jgi:hypothetical protein
VVQAVLPVPVVQVMQGDSLDPMELPPELVEESSKLHRMQQEM